MGKCAALLHLLIEKIPVFFYDSFLSTNIYPALSEKEVLHRPLSMLIFNWTRKREVTEMIILVALRTTLKDSGSYMCVATNRFNQTVFTSNSSEVVITVKGWLSSVVNKLWHGFFEHNNILLHPVPSDVVSDPDISFTVLKEDIRKYSAVVTCQSIKGTPPVTFSLYNRTELVANATVEGRNATFMVPLVLGKHLGHLQCQANNGDRITYSKWIPLEVGMFVWNCWHNTVAHIAFFNVCLFIEP